MTTVYNLDSGAVESNTLYAVQVLTPGATIAVDPTVGGLATLVATATNMSLTAANQNAGSGLVLVVTTSGTTGCVLTFSTGFKSTGTLTTGTSNAKVFTIAFISDGTNYNEVSRTTAM